MKSSIDFKRVWLTEMIGPILQKPSVFEKKGTNNIICAAGWEEEVLCSHWTGGWRGCAGDASLFFCLGAVAKQPVL